MQFQGGESGQTLCGDCYLSDHSEDFDLLPTSPLCRAIHRSLRSVFYSLAC